MKRPVAKKDEVLSAKPREMALDSLALFLGAGALWEGARIYPDLPRPPAVGPSQDWQAF